MKSKKNGRTMAESEDTEVEEDSINSPDDAIIVDGPAEFNDGAALVGREPTKLVYRCTQFSR
jgi:hypothetical protein